MHSQEASDVVMPNGNGETGNDNSGGAPASQSYSSKKKYKELKNRLKYLLYVRLSLVVSECVNHYVLLIRNTPALRQKCPGPKTS